MIMLVRCFNFVPFQGPRGPKGDIGPQGILGPSGLKVSETPPTCNKECLYMQKNIGH